VKTTKITCACCLPVAMALGLLCSPNLVAEEVKLDLLGSNYAPAAAPTLQDFAWTIRELRSAASVKREIPACVGFTDGKDVVLTSEGTPFSIITVTLSAKRSGTFRLIPEFFPMHDGFRYRVCHGIRILEPKRNPRSSAFHPPHNGSVWPAHAGGRIACKKGDPIVFELLFDQLSQQAELFVASPVAVPREHKGK